jgi:cystathionine gamma-synthase
MSEFETQCVQAGNRRDTLNGSVSVPVYRSSTYAHPALGQSTGFDYTRTANPTRMALEEAVACLHHASRAFAFSSGMAAIDAVCRLFKPGDRLVVSDDLYGGTYRLLDRILAPIGVQTTFVDTTDELAVRAALTGGAAALLIETPTNPTMKVSDIAVCSQLAHQAGALSIVDNTFMSPYLQRPHPLGADIVIESATKYLSGHNDLLGGIVTAVGDELSEQIAFVQNTIGAVLGPDDCWLLLRGLKTLAIRMERHVENAEVLAKFLSQHPLVGPVYYPGLSGHKGADVHRQQAFANGGMISFEVLDERQVGPLLARLRLITFAESLGGVESLITYPVRQTHMDIPKAIRDRIGVTDRLLRLSVGIEHIEDLKGDLDTALQAAASEVTTVEV